ncbi:tol-pal system protein YbgF [bacterium]|nr:tol-pal system protein YbgF [bacterium]
MFVSCATKGNLRQMQLESNTHAHEIESRLSALEQSVAGIDSLIKEQIVLSQTLRAFMGSQSRDQSDNISTITARQDEINYQLKELLDRLQSIQLYGGLEKKPETQPSSTAPQPNKTVSQLPSTPSQVKPDPEKLYESALSDIENNNYALAESRFMSFLLQFPDHTLAANAQYWLGEAAYAQKKFDIAIKEFQKVVDQYPKSSKARASLLKIGFTQIEKGDSKTGQETLKKVIKLYKNSDEASLAREKLNEIGK